MTRLIDAEALKQDISTEWLTAQTKQAFYKIIDNAPTVEPEIKKVPIANITFDEEKLKELTDEIVERIKNGEIVLKDERPHGEWKEYGDIYSKGGVKCSICGYQTNNRLQLAVGCGNNYCPNCGADMRGDANDG